MRGGEKRPVDIGNWELYGGSSIIGTWPHSGLDGKYGKDSDF
jgi:hypothetical protein